MRGISVYNPRMNSMTDRGTHPLRSNSKKMEGFSFPIIQPTNPNLPFPEFRVTPLSGMKSCWFLAEEERMDMLWEDLNEEIHGEMKDSKMEAESKTVAVDIELEKEKPDALVFTCVRAMGMRGGSGGLLHCERPRLAMLLKKLFLIQKSSSSPRLSSGINSDATN